MTNIQIDIEDVDIDSLPDKFESDIDELLYRRISEDYGADIGDLSVKVSEDE